MPSWRRPRQYTLRRTSLVTLDVAGFIPVAGETVTFTGGVTVAASNVSGSSLTFEVPEGAQTGAS